MAVKSVLDHPLGTLLDPEDPRDLDYSRLRALAHQTGAVVEEPLPDCVDWQPTGILGPRRDQGRYPTCVAFATIGYKEAQDRALWGAGRTRDYSEILLYKWCKRIDGDPEAEGTYPRSALTLLQALGAGQERDFPYTKELCDASPFDPRFARAEFPNYKIADYARIPGPGIDPSPELLMRALTEGPVLITTGVISGHGWAYPVPDGVINLKPGENPPLLGYHQILLCGYHKGISEEQIRARTHFGDPKAPTTTPGEVWWKFKNSWGYWGLDAAGYGYFNDLWRRQYTTDYWVASQDYTSKLRGDLDGDARLTLSDALLLMRLLAGMKTPGRTQDLMALGDFTRDGTTTVKDVQSLVAKLAGF